MTIKKLIGSDKNQVSLNRDLGSMAFQNKEAVVVDAIDVAAGTASEPSISTVGDTNTGMFFPAADTIAFTEGGVEAMRIDSSGNLLVCTTTTTKNQVVAGQKIVSVNTGTTTQGGASLTTYGSASYAAPWLTFQKSRGTTDGSMTKAESGDTLGYIQFGGADGTNFIAGAAIGAIVDSGTGTNDMPGRLVFYTTADGASTVTERMRIDSTGNLLVGKTSATANGGDLQVSSGITFPATQVAKTDANTLDDYEEGTWTPTYSNWSTNPTTSNAFYTKIGRQVTINMLCAEGVTAGGGIIGGLPFTSRANQGATATIRGVNSNINGVGSIPDSSTQIQNIGAMTNTGYYWTLSVTYIV